MKRMCPLSAILMIGLSLLLGCPDINETEPYAITMENENKRPQSHFLTIGTGGVTGVYYPTGGAIAKMVNQKRSVYGIRATVESTGGSVFNINAVTGGDIEFGIVQSDRQYQAVHGLAEWKERGEQTLLRSVFSIHSESVTLVAAVDAGIEQFEDLRGKRVNIGNPGSGQRQNAIDALRAGGIAYERDMVAEGVKASEAPAMLNDGKIDAFFYTVGHPSAAIKEAAAGRRKVRFISISNIADLLEKYPYYTESLVPVHFYSEIANKNQVKSFGVKATCVTSKRVSEEMVYAITREVLENFDDFKKLHPSYALLTRESMLQGLSAPIHKGALRYYKEVGLK